MKRLFLLSVVLLLSAKSFAIDDEAGAKPDDSAKLDYGQAMPVANPGEQAKQVVDQFAAAFPDMAVDKGQLTAGIADFISANVTFKTVSGGTLTGEQVSRKVTEVLLSSKDATDAKSVSISKALTNWIKLMAIRGRGRQGPNFLGGSEPGPQVDNFFLGACEATLSGDSQKLASFSDSLEKAVKAASDGSVTIDTAIYYSLPENQRDAIVAKLKDCLAGG